MRQNLTGVTHQRDKQPVLDGRQVHLALPDRDAAVSEIDLELTDREGGLVVRSRGPTTQRRPDTGEQLFGPERLAHVVICPGIQRADLVALLPAGREDNDGDRRPLPKPADDLQAIHVREAEVEDDHVGLTGGRIGQRIGSRGRLEQAVTLTGECRAQEPSNRQLVLDEKDGRIRHPPEPCSPLSP